jgi:hypothetical protein
VLHGAILTEYEDRDTGRRRRKGYAKDAKKRKKKEKEKVVLLNQPLPQFIN